MDQKSKDKMYRSMVSITMRLTVDQITKEVDNVTKGCKRQLPDTQFVSLFSSTQWNLGRVPAEGSRPFSN